MAKRHPVNLRNVSTYLSPKRLRKNLKGFQRILRPRLLPWGVSQRPTRMPDLSKQGHWAMLGGGPRSRPGGKSSRQVCPSPGDHPSLDVGRRPAFHLAFRAPASPRLLIPREEVPGVPGMAPGNRALSSPTRQIAGEKLPRSPPYRGTWPRRSPTQVQRDESAPGSVHTA